MSQHTPSMEECINNINNATVAAMPPEFNTFLKILRKNHRVRTNHYVDYTESFIEPNSFCSVIIVYNKLNKDYQAHSKRHSRFVGGAPQELNIITTDLSLLITFVLGVLPVTE